MPHHQKSVYQKRLSSKGEHRKVRIVNIVNAYHRWVRALTWYTTNASTLRNKTKWRRWWWRWQRDDPIPPEKLDGGLYKCRMTGNHWKSTDNMNDARQWRDDGDKWREKKRMVVMSLVDLFVCCYPCLPFYHESRSRPLRENRRNQTSPHKHNDTPFFWLWFFLCASSLCLSFVHFPLSCVMQEPSLGETEENIEHRT